METQSNDYLFNIKTLLHTIKPQEYNNNTHCLIKYCTYTHMYSVRISPRCIIL